MWLGRKIKLNNSSQSLPLDVEQTITCFCRLLFLLQSNDNHQLNCRKARRKEREGSDTPTQSDSKLYLESTVLERKFPDIDFKLLVDLPAGLDYNEWLASHSKLTSQVNKPDFFIFVLFL